LGCTAIWLSPVFENNPESYHDYAIQNYLDVDKRWGTIHDLEELVELAHDYDMRVFLDIVLHFTGDNWAYHPTGVTTLGSAWSQIRSWLADASPIVGNRRLIARCAFSNAVVNVDSGTNP
jgi:hypothetical protein